MLIIQELKIAIKTNVSYLAFSLIVLMVACLIIFGETFLRNYSGFFVFLTFVAIMKTVPYCLTSDYNAGILEHLLTIRHGIIKLLLAKIFSYTIVYGAVILLINLLAHFVFRLGLSFVDMASQAGILLLMVLALISTNLLVAGLLVIQINKAALLSIISSPLLIPVMILSIIALKSGKWQLLVLLNMIGLPVNLLGASLAIRVSLRH